MLRISASFLILNLMAFSIGAQEMTEQEKEEWFFDDSDFRASQVNEGELVFLKSPPGEPVHHHHNTLIISDRSLSEGWVELHQCHSNMDKVGLAEVVFKKNHVRNIRVTEAQNIGQAYVEDGSVQLKNVRQGARLCIAAESRALQKNEDNTYTLRSGPFMRRFLDGYYPMHVSMDVQLDSVLLRFASISPGEQQGLRTWQTDSAVHMEAWFEGKLKTEIRFHNTAEQASLD